MSHTMAKFFLSKRSSKVAAGGRVFEFVPADYFEPTHSWWCIYSAETDDEIEALEGAVKAGLISEISEEEYNEYDLKKKTARVSGNIVNLNNWHSPSQSAPSGRGVQVVEDPAPREAQSVVETVSEAVAPKQLATPPPRRKK